MYPRIISTPPSLSAALGDIFWLTFDFLAEEIIPRIILKRALNSQHFQQTNAEH